MVDNRLKKTSVVLLLLFSFISAQSIESMMAAGQELLRAGAFNQAVTQFRQVVSREPANFEAQYNLGFAYLGWGRHSNAVEEFKKALRLNARSSEVWSNLAIAYENLGKSQDAINALYQAVSIDPNNLTARANLAAMYANQNQIKQAVVQYKEIIKIDGMNEDALTNLTKCLVGAGQIEEAKHYLKQLIVANPNDGYAHWELGNIYWKKENDIDRAINEYKLAISVQPDGGSYYENLALAYEQKNDKKTAIDTWKTSLIYLDDALQKEKIEDRIKFLEGGNVGPSGENLEMKPASREQINDLRKELRKEEKKTQTKRITTAPVDIMGDFNDLNAEEDESNPLDLQFEAKKRAKE